MGQYVKYYSSQETGAPTLNNTVGSMISVLDACLVNGFNSKTVSSITVSGNVATVVVASHGFDTNSYLDPDITIEGATPSSLNGSKQVTYIDTNTFTFPAVGVPDGAATGTITAKRSPIGWQKVFSGTGKGIYKSSDISATTQMLRVDDSLGNNKDCRVMGVESATGIDTYTDPYPTNTQASGGGYWTKGPTTTTAKNWSIVGDSKFFYFLIEASVWNSSHSDKFYVYGFGDIITYRPADQFNSVIFCGTTATVSYASSAFPRNSSSNTTGTFSAGSASHICRDFSGSTKSALINTCMPYLDITNGLKVYPSPVNNGVVITEGCLIYEQNEGLQHPIRGEVPGAAMPIVHANNYPNTYTTTCNFTKISTLSNKKYIVFCPTSVQTSTTGTFAIRVDINWRA